jgi:hypothetical protein
MPQASNKATADTANPHFPIFFIMFPPSEIKA